MAEMTHAMDGWMWAYLCAAMALLTKASAWMMGDMVSWMRV